MNTHLNCYRIRKSEFVRKSDQKSIIEILIDISFGFIDLKKENLLPDKPFMAI